MTPHINSKLSDSFCIGKLELVHSLKIYQKIGSNFSRGKLERVVVYPAWQLFFIIIFTADRGKGVPSFDEMMDFTLVELDFDDPTTNVRGRRALAIAKPTPRGY